MPFQPIRESHITSTRMECPLLTLKRRSRRVNSYSTFSVLLLTSPSRKSQSLSTSENTRTSPLSPRDSSNRALTSPDLPNPIWTRKNLLISTSEKSLPLNPSRILPEMNRISTINTNRELRMRTPNPSLIRSEKNLR